MKYLALLTSTNPFATIVQLSSAFSTWSSPPPWRSSALWAPSIASFWASNWPRPKSPGTRQSQKQPEKRPRRFCAHLRADHRAARGSAAMQNWVAANSPVK